MLTSLVGEDNARRGATTLFEALQNPNLNKHLAYSLIEIFLNALMPEMKDGLPTTAAAASDATPSPPSAPSPSAPPPTPTPADLS